MEIQFKQLTEALKVFNLPQKATIKQIKARHKVLVKRYHPDTGKGDTEEMRRVNQAYQVLMEDCSSYRFSFSEAEFCTQRPEEMIRQQFYSDPLWGSGSKK